MAKLVFKILKAEVYIMKKLLLITFLTLFLTFLSLVITQGKTVYVNKPAQTAGRHLVIAVCRDANAIEMLDADQLKSLGRIPVGESPHEVISSSDGKLLYVANYGTKDSPGNSLSVIDLMTFKEVKKIDLGDLKRPHGLEEREGKIYFTAEGSKMVGRFNPQTERVDWTAKTDQMVSHMIAVNSNASFVYTANMLSNTVSVIDVKNSNESQTRQIPVGKEPEGIALSPDGKFLWIGHRRDGLISIIDTATQSVTQTLTLGQMPLRLRFTPDGQRLFAINPQEGYIAVFNAQTKAEIVKINMDGAPVGLVFSQDGVRLFVTDLKNNKVISFDSQTFKILGEVSVENLSDGIGYAAGL